MDGSRLLPWFALASFVVAVGTLLRARFQPEDYDPRTRLITEMIATIAAGATLGPLPRLFHLEYGALWWGIEALSVAFTVQVWVQLIRLGRMKKVDTVQQ